MSQDYLRSSCLNASPFGEDSQPGGYVAFSKAGGLGCVL